MRTVLLLAVLLVACTPDDQKTESINAEDVRAARAALPPELVMRIDSGNAAFKEKDYPRALTHYRAAVELDRKQPAGWFGIYMSELALGNAAAADSALEKAQSLAPGSSLLR